MTMDRLSALDKIIAPDGSSSSNSDISLPDQNELQREIESDMEDNDVEGFSETREQIRSELRVADFSQATSDEDLEMLKDRDLDSEFKVLDSLILSYSQ